MKQFLKFTFASVIGFVIGSFLLMFLLGALFATFISVLGKDETKEIPYNSVVVLKFNGPVNERTDNNPLNTIDFSTLKTRIQPGLNEILKSIKYAQSDERIMGIVIEAADVQAGISSLTEIRDALVSFKESGKFVVSYSDYYSQKAYYLNSVADEVWMNPEGFLWFAGLSSEMPFFKGLFDKLGIEPQIVRAGKYKSAAEPFSEYAMSQANKDQVQRYTDEIWTHMLNDISYSRNVSIEDLRFSAESSVLKRATECLDNKMITNKGYRDEFDDALYKRLQLKGNDRPSKISLRHYAMSAKWPGGETLSRDKVAIIYATGAILDGGDGRESVSAPLLAQEIYEAGTDERIKAVVLRVNSPGGSAIGSETILHALQKVKKEKPIIISMGNVAASGGYYISCASDTIIASRNTITGSIGVIGMMFNAQNLLNEKLGISFDGYKTGPYADFPNVTRPLSDGEYKWMNQMMDSVYHTFVSRVSEGRSMNYDVVDSLGQGRVWVGTDAVANGLVDMSGGLLDAIGIAAKKAELENYRIVELPYQKDPFVQMVEDISGEGISLYQKIKYGALYMDMIQLRKLVEFEGFMTRIPMFYPIH